MDQAGAIVGPLMVSAALYLQYGYSDAFAILVVPATISMVVVISARFLFPRPRDFDLKPPVLDTGGFKSAYWMYMVAIALIGAGYADFPLIAYHFGQSAVVSPPLIPMLYALAMASDAAASLVLGPLFDRRGLVILVFGLTVAAAASPLVFLGDAKAAVVGMILWGIGMGTQESVMRAVVAGVVPIANARVR